MFKGRTLLIASKHNKEAVMYPLFEQCLGVSCIVALDFDTDQLGTFSGEIERQLSPLFTVREKCVKALQLYRDYDLVVASEGSFGPHPMIPFVYSNEELVMLYDSKNDLEIYHCATSLATNFSTVQLLTENDLYVFTENIGYPSHGIILNIFDGEDHIYIKDIRSYKTLLDIFYTYKAKGTIITAQTDMRAMNNPTRMKVIRDATVMLLEKINSKCPQCHRPGFSVIKNIPGLPCALCHSPTRSVARSVYCCTGCNYSREIEFPYGKREEEPGKCDRCNP